MNAPDGLLETVSDVGHLEKIKAIWTKNKTSMVSPGQVQKHHSLLDAQNKTIYSEQAIQRVLDELSRQSAQGRLTPDNRIRLRLCTVGPWISTLLRAAPVLPLCVSVLVLADLR